MGSLFKLPVRLRQALNVTSVFIKGVPARAAGTTPAEFLLAVRTKLGLSQTDLAERAGISQQYVQQLESGKIDARLGTWRRLFDALHCDVILLPKPRQHLGEVKARRVLG